MPSVKLAGAPMGAVLQVGAAAVGSVEIATWPLSSAATHNAVEAHEIALGFRRPVSESLHVCLAAVGSVEITAWPLSSMATHSAVEGHEIPDRSGTEAVSAPVARAGPGESTPAASSPANHPPTSPAPRVVHAVCRLSIALTSSHNTGPGGKLQPDRSSRARRGVALPRGAGAAGRQPQGEEADGGRGRRSPAVGCPIPPPPAHERSVASEREATSEVCVGLRKEVGRAFERRTDARSAL